MTVKVYKLSDEHPNGFVRSVYETNRASVFLIKKGFFVIIADSGFIEKFSTKLYGCYVVA